MFHAKFVVKNYFHILCPTYSFCTSHKLRNKNYDLDILEKNSSKVTRAFVYWDKNHLPDVCSLVRETSTIGRLKIWIPVFSKSP